MAQSLKIIVYKWPVPTYEWNKVVHPKQQVDIISEIHLSEKHYIKILSYSIYHTIYLDDTARIVVPIRNYTAIIIKNIILHRK